ncbi:hypothetical protein KPL47_18640 [Clostridium estertheticum]|uniref:hypothetical protein n=1 Tax=Clostridium estertheticum TaxID=238834 RepID=UPI001C0B7987|nr:hypothetical protein [Clostridium estertheticum]MBU3178346.1 hypothetical protein [Clostridium estertheticum]
MKKIRSGQAYLYRDGGIRSTVFDIRMKDKVRGDLLRRALDKAMERYPYLTSKLVEKNGDYYIAHNLLPVILAKTDKFRALGSMKVNYNLIDVTYKDKKICVAFHHALCDGRGIMPFIKTLLYYYCCAKYNKTFNATGIRLAGEPLLPGETMEPFGDSKYDIGNTPMPEIVKDGYTLPENVNEVSNYYRYEININRDKFMAFAKENNASPAILVALLASKSIKKLHPGVDKPIVCNMASDMRKELGLENTHKNCVSSLYLPYTEAVEKLFLNEQATMYRNIIKQQRHPDVVKGAANNQIGLSDKLDQLETLSEKKQMLSFFNDFCINTFVISYAGQLQLGECEKYVDSMHLYSSGTKGLILNMLSAGDYITVDLLQSFESEQFASEFMHSLEEIGLEYNSSQRIDFKTTQDKTFVTGGRQAEKYYGKFEN